MPWWAQHEQPIGAARRRSAIDRRRQILDSALQAFAEHGYDAVRSTGMQSIAQRSGVHKAALYRMFGDRLGLYRATVALAAERFVDIVTTARQAGASHPPAHRARTFLLALLSGIRQQPAVWFTLTDRPSDSQAAGALAGAQAKVRTAIIQGALAEERSRQPALSDREVEWAARFLYGGLSEVLRSHLPHAPASDDGALVEFLLTVSGRAPAPAGRAEPAGDGDGAAQRQRQ